VLGILSNREKSDWRSLAKSSQTCTSLRCTRLSGVHRTVSGAQTNMPLFGKTQHVAVITHWTVWCAPDCLVSQPRQLSVARSAGDTSTSPMVTRLHRTPRCATGPVATTVGFAGKGRKLHTVYCSVVHRTIRCAHEHKATMAFQMEL
jgi:hypothetical protein